jgi:putative PIN family toxin of toxin-antitoxin system
VRLVLDTNVVLSALLWRGAPYQLLTAVRREPERLRLFSSEALLSELAEVLRRPHLAEPLAAIGRPLAQVIADYVAAVELVVPTDVPRIARDPDDDQILACALTAQANLIVSGDDDLLSLGDHQGIPILPAAQALKRIQGGG